MLNQQILDEGLDISPFGSLKLPGVYIVLMCARDEHDRPTGELEPVYIGSSNNIFRRTMSTSHIYRKLFDKYSETHFVVIADKYTDDYLHEERRLILKYRPKYNKQFNGIEI